MVLHAYGIRRRSVGTSGLLKNIIFKKYRRALLNDTFPGMLYVRRENNETNHW